MADDAPNVPFRNDHFRNRTLSCTTRSLSQSKPRQLGLPHQTPQRRFSTCSPGAATRRSKRWSLPSRDNAADPAARPQELADQRARCRRHHRRRQRQSQHRQHRLRPAPCRDGGGEGIDRARRRELVTPGKLALHHARHDDGCARQGDRGTAPARAARGDQQHGGGFDPRQVPGDLDPDHRRLLARAEPRLRRHARRRLHQELSLRPAHDQHRRHRCRGTCSNIATTRRSSAGR